MNSDIYYYIGHCYEQIYYTSFSIGGGEGQLHKGSSMFGGAIIMALNYPYFKRSFFL